MEPYNKLEIRNQKLRTMKNLIIIITLANLLICTSAFTQPQWLTSCAPLGIASAHDYVGALDLTFTHPSTESLRVHTFGGAPTGVHIYRVDRIPNTQTGIIGAGSNDRYFGVFVVGGANPTYTAVYNYGGNPNVSPVNEANLLLFGRFCNNVTPWANLGAALNTTANTLTKTGEVRRGEYILGISGTPLPVELLSFTANWSDGYTSVKLDWQTATEINNDYFVVERSTDAINFIPVVQTPGAGNSNQVLTYTSFDNSPYTDGTSYYRLKQVDFDGSYEYSSIVTLDLGNNIDITTLYPNPVVGNLTYTVSSLTDKDVKINIYNNIGQLVLSRENHLNKGLTKLQVNVSNLSSGKYIIQVLSDTDVVRKSFINREY